MNKAVLGLCFVFVGLFWNQIWERIPDLLIMPEKPSVVQIEKPENQNILDKTSSIADLVDEEEDMVRLAIFNDIWASMMMEVDSSTAQQVIDFYTKAGRNVFGSTMAGKYAGYGAAITELMEDILGDEGSEDYEISDEQKGKLSDAFRALAWNLVN